VARANATRILKRADLPTENWFRSGGEKGVVRFAHKFLSRSETVDIAVCSVVPRATPHLRKIARGWGARLFELNARTVSQVGVRYPRPDTIGADRLANAVAARHKFGAPVVVVDFGTAVTFDVVDRHGDYVGGIIAPGLAAMTDYLHEKTALLPRIKIRDVRQVIGKSTEQAMLIGAVHGYRGMIRELVGELRRHLRVSRLPVVATGGYAALVASKLPEVTAVDTELTLEGLRLEWLARTKCA
jgi:type III pantothenate kinase